MQSEHQLDQEFVIALTSPTHDFVTQLEKQSGVQIFIHGTTLTIQGKEPNVEKADVHIQNLIQLYQERGQIYMADLVVNATAITKPLKTTVQGLDGPIKPRNEAQRVYLETIHNHPVTFGIGPAGTGKTYLAVAAGVKALQERKVKRIILTRPVVEAGEKLGFLPGTLEEKINPYLRPLLDALQDMIKADELKHMLENGVIEIAPLAYMRGRTLSNAFAILDEAQNATPDQLKMFLTRLGENSQFVINGDPTQTDLPRNAPHALKHAERILKNVTKIGWAPFGRGDVVRHELVSEIIDAYDQDHAAYMERRAEKEAQG